MLSLKQQVLATMKSSDTEGTFELYMTRTPGYLWARLFYRMGVHPIAVTLLSIVIGCSSGYFFYFDSVGYNMVGALLLIWANWYDCADGQLARMANKQTKIGRFLDGLAGDLWFTFIYIALALRLTPQWGLWIWVLMLWAGFFCHARQCSLADYYRNAHLFFIGKANDLDRSDDLKNQYKELKWGSRKWFEKLYLFLYTSYTCGQEKHTPNFQRLYNKVGELYKQDIPTSLRQRYRSFSKLLMPACQVLTFDLRVMVLFLSLLIGLPWIYFVVEVTALEVLRIHTNRRHERFCMKLVQHIDENTNNTILP